MINILTDLQAALRELGHDADEVQNAPTDMLNVWLDGEGRIPVATVLYAPGEDAGTLTWGHNWEHSASTSADLRETANRIIATSSPDLP